MKPFQDKKGFWILVKNPTYLYMTKTEGPHFDPMFRIYSCIPCSRSRFGNIFLEFSCRKLQHYTHLES